VHPLPRINPLSRAIKAAGRPHLWIVHSLLRTLQTEAALHGSGWRPQQNYSARAASNKKREYNGA
jgi:hypothetical protein